ncbi:MAG: hypothetical protein F6K58_19910 [Symploca sp. SIO2E9]|nr:hypothetical protein [Symploca sp. SIO2E9]
MERTHLELISENLMPAINQVRRASVWAGRIKEEEPKLAASTLDALTSLEFAAKELEKAFDAIDMVDDFYTEED